jgi:signal transduction histidine kinase
MRATHPSRATPFASTPRARGDSAVTVCVEDNGTGIPVELLGKVFEPFVTTKDPGKGTGLGLSLVYSIIEDHQGHIAIESPLDTQSHRGTRIVLTLPRWRENTASTRLDTPAAAHGDGDTPESNV